MTKSRNKKQKKVFFLSKFRCTYQSEFRKKKTNFFLMPTSAMFFLLYRPIIHTVRRKIITLSHIERFQFFIFSLDQKRMRNGRTWQVCCSPQKSTAKRKTERNGIHLASCSKSRVTRPKVNFLFSMISFKKSLLKTTMKFQGKAVFILF